ncbi:MAG: TIGR03862 family flavoprotein [Beijerinckiaceae bacterium]
MAFPYHAPALCWKRQTVYQTKLISETRQTLPLAPKKNALVVGAGPAGLIAADILSAAGVAVTVCDRMPSPARKFLMAGRGGLNITHSEPLDAFLARYGAARGWLAPLIARFSPDDMRAFCENLGETAFTGSSGRVFPKSFKTSPLLRAWLRKLDRQGVVLHLRHKFTGWDEKGAALFDTPDGRMAITAGATILALGGASWPRLGSDGGWKQTLAERGVAITPFQPANCGFETDWPTHVAERFEGTPLKSIAAEFQGRRIEGECTMASYGLEGGLIYALSAPLRDAIARDGSAVLHIDLKPAVATETLAQRLAAAPKKQSLANRLRKAARLTPAAIALLHTGETPADPHQLAARIKAVPVRLTAARPIERAISTAGGIAREALDESLMLKALPGVFAAGEMLDWEAPTGGYLLQASFATGAAAAHGALAWLGYIPATP